MADNDDEIPVIDMSRPDAVVAKELLEAFQTIGFATLTNHGVDSDVIEGAFTQSKSFFSLPTETKLQYKFQGYESNRGYIPLGKESHEIKPDRKETFDIGNEADAEFSNVWPTEELSDKFRSDLVTYFDAFDSLHLRIMKLLAVGMKLEDTNFFVERCNERHENLRLLHYPGIEHDGTGDDNEPIMRGSVHTDFGTITLLTQDSVGGLRAQKIDGKWVNVPPVANSVVVNVGDMLQRWSNDTLRATPHQVVELNHNNSGVIPERYSIAFFCNANKNVMLDCLEACTSPESPPRYESMKAHDYLTLRLSQTISKDASK